jgi:hypothetical protein
MVKAIAVVEETADRAFGNSLGAGRVFRYYVCCCGVKALIINSSCAADQVKCVFRQDQSCMHNRFNHFSLSQNISIQGQVTSKSEAAKPSEHIGLCFSSCLIE